MSPMKLLTVSVGRPKEVAYVDRRGREQTATTGIFKEPVESRIMLRATNLEAITATTLAVGTSSSSTAIVQRARLGAAGRMTPRDCGFKPIWLRIRGDAPWLFITNRCSVQKVVIQACGISGSHSTRLAQISR